MTSECICEDGGHFKTWPKLTSDLKCNTCGLFIPDKFCLHSFDQWEVSVRLQNNFKYWLTCSKVDLMKIGAQNIFRERNYIAPPATISELKELGKSGVLMRFLPNYGRKTNNELNELLAAWEKPSRKIRKKGKQTLSEYAENIPLYNHSRELIDLISNYLELDTRHISDDMVERAAEAIAKYELDRYGAKALEYYKPVAKAALTAVLQNKGE